MGTWKSRGLRGSNLEEMINHSNQVYQEMGLALIQKIPTPITPIQIDQSSRQITLAYFNQKSTVDYIGVVQGVAVCFDAKECHSDTFRLANVHPHQMVFMENFEAQQGVAFLIIHYTRKNQLYYLPYRELAYYWKRMEEGGRKSISFEEMCKEYPIGQHRDVLVHYLVPLGKDLNERN